MDRNFLKGVGVIVIGRNEGERLVRCLKSLPIDAENVVYVDSGSTDGSVVAALQLGVTPVSLDMTRPFTAARARNEGLSALLMRNASIRFVQFVDGDCELIDGWIDTAVKFLLDHSNAAVVCGRRRERFPKRSIYNLLCDLEWNTSVGETTACGGDSLMKVESFRAAGGFTEGLMAGEEPELCARLRDLGWKIWRLDVEMSLHDAAITRFSQWWRRSVRCGYGYAQVWQLTRQSLQALYKKETARALFWGGVLPTIIIGGSFIHPAATIIGVIIYALQIVRIALRRGPTLLSSWTYATYITVAKFAETQGILSFFWHNFRHKTAQTIEYKGS